MSEHQLLAFYRQAIELGVDDVSAYKHEQVVRLPEDGIVRHEGGYSEAT
jgi:hypothetical protein